MEEPRQTVWSRDFTLHWVANFLISLGFYFLLPTLPVFAVKALGADKSQVGYIIGIYTLSAVAIRPFVGYALDTLGRRKVYLWAIGFFALLAFSYQLAFSLLLLFILRLLHGFTWGATTTGGGTIAADLLPTQRRGEGIGYFGLSMTLAMALGPVVGLWLMGDNSYDTLFLSSGGLTVAALVAAAMVKYPTLTTVKRPLVWEAFFERRVFHVCIAMFFATVTYGGIISFITLYSEEIGIRNGGLFFLIYAIALSLTRPIAGRLMDRHGPSPVIVSGFILLIAGFLSLWASHQLAGFAMAAVLIGIGNGNIWPTLQTMVINLVQPQRRGVANSTYFSAVDLGIGTGSIMLGFLADKTSLGTIYLVSAVILLIPLVYLLLYVSRDYKHKMAEVRHG